MKLYNTLSKSTEEFKPLHTDHVNMYTCGPTVYNFAHIGNLRSYIMADLLYRTLKFLGFDPRWTMNITDIDDKTIKGAIAEFGEKASVKDLKRYTQKYYEAFLSDLTEVNVSTSEIQFIKVTDVIPEIQAFIIQLMDKGYAYKAEDGVYFSIEKYQADFKDYGSLVGEKFLEGKKIGARVAVDEYEKDNLSDFALWKAHDAKTDAQIFWDHPVLGKGRPGWHIECSVINRVAFGGEATDIHTGGVDLIFPHHTNEIAQSQPIYKPYVNYWHHCEHLQVENKKMAKRDGNVYLLSDLKARGFSGNDLRYFFLTSGFQNQQNFTWKGLEAAKNARSNLFLKARDLLLDNRLALSDIDATQAVGASLEFNKALNDNLNFPKILATVWVMLDNEDITLAQKFSLLTQYDKVLGLNLDKVKEIQNTIPDDIRKLIDLRKQAKIDRDFAKSDELRKQLEVLGYEVKDTSKGQDIRQKISL